MKLKLIIIAMALTGLLTWQVRTAPETRTEYRDVLAIHASASKRVPALRGPAQINRKEDLLQEATKKHGYQLRVESETEGVITKLKGQVAESSQGGSSFDPKNPEMIRSHALEVLKDFAELLGIEEISSLSLKGLAPGQSTAQVTFEQSNRDASLEPWGKITMNFGPRGELLNLDSSYLPHVEISNSKVIGSEAAVQSAELSLTRFQNAQPSEFQQLPSVAKSIIWISRVSGGVAKGHHAYQVQVAGRRVIVDAETSRILSQRDQRYD